MKKGKFGIAVFSVAVLLLILLLALPEGSAKPAGIPVTLELSPGQTLKLWTEDGDTYYAFLPGHADPEALQLVAPAGMDAEVGGYPLPVACGTLLPHQDHVLSWKQNGEVHRKSLRILTASGTATLYLNTQSGSMDYIHEQKGNGERGSLQLYAGDGTLNFSGVLSAVRGRGNSTWVIHEKKPYSLELTEEADLLGMGAAKKWILLADALDPSSLRNKIVYDFAARLGLAYTPQAQWTEVYLNGEYAGLYLLCERVEADPQRVDLGPDGSLVCMDRDIRVLEKTDPYFVTDANQYLRIIDGNDIGTLKIKFQAMEDALLSGVEWQDHIDLDSWVKKYLLEEVFGNYDAGFQSQYFYVTEPAGKIYAGPVWDYDSSLGNPGVWALNSPRGLYACRPEAMVDSPTPWFHALYEQDAFRKELQRQYEQILPQLQRLTVQIAQDYPQTIVQAHDRNRIRWTVETQGAEAEAARIAAYLKDRLTFLSQLWLEESTFRILRLQEAETAGYYGYYAVEPGSTFQDLPVREEEGFLGWYRMDTGTIFDPEAPIQQDLQLYPHYEGAAPERQGHDTGLMDRILEVYEYVPGLVLVFLGILLLPFSIYRSRTSKAKKKQPIQ